MRMGKRVIALVMSICMVLTMFFGTKAMDAVAAEAAGFCFNVMDGNGTGKVYYKIGDGSWIDIDTIEPDGGGTLWIPGNVALGSTLYLRAVPDEGYQILQAEVGDRGQGQHLGNEDYAALMSEEGYAYTVSLLEAEFAVRFGTGGGQPGPQSDYTLDFGNGSISGSTVTYQIDGKAATLTVTGSPIVNDEVTIPRDDLAAVQFTLGGAFDASTMEVAIFFDDGFTSSLAVENGVTSLAKKQCDNFPDGQIHLEIRVKNNNPPGPGPGPNQPNPDDGDYVISFGSGEVDGNTITYDLQHDTLITITVKGTTVENREIRIPRNDEGSVTFEVSDNYDPDNMGITLRAQDGFTAYLAVENGVTSLLKRNCDGFPGDELILEVCRGNNSGPGPEPENSKLFTYFHENNYYEGANSTESHSSVSLDGEADFAINDSEMTGLGMEPGQYQNVNYRKLIGEDDTVDFYFSILFISQYTQIKINGVDYTNQLPTSKEDLLAAFHGQKNIFMITGVPWSEEYNIVVKRTDNPDPSYIVIGNFLWTLGAEDPEAPTDDRIDGGRIEIAKAVYNEEVLFEEDKNGDGQPEVDKLATDTCAYWGGSSYIGSAVFPEGTMLTVHLIPEYGKQLVRFSVNDAVFSAEEDVATYTFEIHKGNFHLGAFFDSVENIVVAESNAVSAGIIDLSNDEIDSGSVVLNVDDANVNATEQAAFEKSANGYIVDSYLDISLDQVCYKGTTEDMWHNEMTELKNEAVIGLSLEKGVPSESVEIIHQKHDGTYEVLPVEIDEKTGTVYFETDSFSKYAIAYKQTIPGTVLLKQAKAASTYINVTWEADPAAESYLVYRKVAGGKWGKIGTTEATSYKDNTAEAGVEYYYTIIAQNAYGKSVSYDKNGVSAIITAVPGAVVLVDVTVGKTALRVNYKPVLTATAYVIYRKAPGESWVNIGTSTTNSYVDQTAIGGIEYTYTVKAKNKNGISASYDKVGVTGKIVAVPGAVKLTGTVVGKTAIRVNFEKVATAESYKIYRKELAGKWIQIGTSNTNTFVDQTAIGGIEYYYTVKAVNRNGASASYDKIGVSGKITAVPGTVKLTGTAIGKTAIRVNFEKVATAESYKIYRKEQGGEWAQIGTSTTNTYVDQTVIGGIEYYYTVKAVNRNGASASYDTTGVAGKIIAVPGVVSLISATAYSGYINVKWNPTATASSYVVYRKTAGGSYKKLVTTADTNINDKTAVKGVTYTYTVIAVNANGTSATYDKIGVTATAK